MKIPQTDGSDRNRGTTGRMNRLLRSIAMWYVLLVIPALLVYGGIRLFTDLRGKELFNSFLPVVLILLVLYVYYLIRPFRLLGISVPSDRHDAGDIREEIQSESRTSANIESH